MHCRVNAADQYVSNLSWVAGITYRVCTLYAHTCWRGRESLGVDVSVFFMGCVTVHQSVCALVVTVSTEPVNARSSNNGCTCL